MQVREVQYSLPIRCPVDDSFPYRSYGVTRFNQCANYFLANAPGTKSIAGPYGLPRSYSTLGKLEIVLVVLQFAGNRAEMKKPSLLKS